MNTDSPNNNSSSNQSDFIPRKSCGTLLVDFEQINDVDIVVEDCKKFLLLASDMNFSLFPIMTRFSSGVKNWNTKRRDTKLVTIYDDLYPRILMSITLLRNTIDDALHKRIEIRQQANNLKIRLESCIEYLKVQIQLSDSPVEELRAIINKLSGESGSLKDMIEFNKEILKSLNIEKKSNTYSSRWGMKNTATKKDISAAELNSDDMHPIFDARLIALRKLRDQMVSSLACVLEKRGTHLANLDNCEHGLRLMNGVISKKNQLAAESNTNTTNNSDQLLENKQNTTTSTTSTTTKLTDEDNFSFDHSKQCSDCSYGYSKACDCISLLNALEKQSTEATNKLISLVEMRERVIEEALKLQVTTATSESLSSDISSIPSSYMNKNNNNNTTNSTNNNNTTNSTNNNVKKENNYIDNDTTMIK